MASSRPCTRPLTGLGGCNALKDPFRTLNVSKGSFRACRERGEYFFNDPHSPRSTGKDRGVLNVAGPTQYVHRMSYLVGLVGAGIGTSLSPALHEAEADALGLRYLYRVLDLDSLGVPAGDVVRAARLGGYTGLNVTHPVKQL